MQTLGIYDATPRFVHLYAFNASGFTGKERDAESGLDNFGARYFGSNMGRFMSPDWSDDPDPVPYADLENPQSLNLYSYAGNNPLIHIDADGHCWPQWLCNLVTEVKNELFHGEFTTDTTGAKIRQLDRQEAKDRLKQLTIERMGNNPPEVRYGAVFDPLTLSLLPMMGQRTTSMSAGAKLGHSAPRERRTAAE